MVKEIPIIKKAKQVLENPEKMKEMQEQAYQRQNKQRYDPDLEFKRFYENMSRYEKIRRQQILKAQSEKPKPKPKPKAKPVQPPTRSYQQVPHPSQKQVRQARQAQTLQRFRWNQPTNRRIRKQHSGNSNQEDYNPYLKYFI